MSELMPGFQEVELIEPAVPQGTWSLRLTGQGQGEFIDSAFWKAVKAELIASGKQEVFDDGTGTPQRRYTIVNKSGTQSIAYVGDFLVISPTSLAFYSTPESPTTGIPNMADKFVSKVDAEAARKR